MATRRRKNPNLEVELSREAQECINSIRPERFEFYRSNSLSALDSYVGGWMSRATFHKYRKPDGSAFNAINPWVKNQVAQWAKKRRPYKYNGYWEKQEVEPPGNEKKSRTASPLQKTTRRRRRTAS